MINTILKIYSLICLILGLGFTGCRTNVPDNTEASITLSGTTGIPLLNDGELSVTLTNGIRISSVDARYTVRAENDGANKKYYFTDAEEQLDFSLVHRALDSTSARVEVTVVNQSDSSLFIDRIESISGTLTREKEETTQALVTSADWQDDRIIYALSDTLHRIESMFTLAVNNPALAAGFLTGKQHFNHFTLRDTLDQLTLSAWGEGNGCELQAGTSRAADPLFISLADNSLMEMERFAQLSAEENQVKLWPENRAVWCTWYAGWNRERMYDYKDGIAQGVSDNLPLVKKHFLSRGGNTMRICDDHIAYGDWNDTTQAFPQGLTNAAEEIRDQGLIPGVWYPTYWASTGSQIFENHPEWMAREPDGSPYILKSEFQNRSRLEEPYQFSVFDTSIPEVQDYFEEVASRWRQRGFRYVTNDFLAFATAPDHYHDPTFSKAQVLRAGLEAVKRGLGDNVFYRTIGGQFGTVTGLSHDVRIGGDSHGDRPFAYHRTGAVWFYNHRTWINDPSAIIFMRYGELRDVEWNKMWVSWIALAGTVMTYGEQLEDLPEEYIDIYKRVFPPLKVAGRPLDLWENQPYTLWGMQPELDDPEYCLFGIFDLYGKGQRQVTLNLDEVFARSVGPASVDNTTGMPSRYLLWDYWNSTLVESEAHELAMDMPEKSCRLFALRKHTGVPQLLGTNGHFSMGALETEAVAWDANSNQLTAQVKGNGNDATTLFFYLPETFQLTTATLAGQAVKTQFNDQVLSVFIPASTSMKLLSLAFSGSASPVTTRKFVSGNPAQRY